VKAISSIASNAARIVNFFKVPPLRSTNAYLPYANSATFYRICLAVNVSRRRPGSQNGGIRRICGSGKFFSGAEYWRLGRLRLPLGVIVLDTPSGVFVWHERGPLADGGESTILLDYERGPIGFYDDWGCSTVGQRNETVFVYRTKGLGIVE
jgi:hypothetical protein